MTKADTARKAGSREAASAQGKDKMPAPRQESNSEMEALNAKSVTCMSVMERLGGVCAAGASPRDECRNQHKNLNKHTEYTPVTLCPDRTSSRPPKHAASRFPTRGAVRSCDAPTVWARSVAALQSSRHRRGQARAGAPPLRPHQQGKSTRPGDAPRRRCLSISYSIG